MEKNIWLFTLAISINGLNNSHLKFYSFIIGSIIYFYYLNDIFGKYSFKDKYQELNTIILKKYIKNKDELKYNILKIKGQDNLRGLFLKISNRSL